METEEYELMYRLERDNWWYVEKRKLIFEILNRLPTGSDTKILDVGCGTGFTLKKLQGSYHAVGLDSDKKALEFCTLQGCNNLVHGDAERLSFKDNNFDIIIALDILEHLNNDLASINGFYRILKEGGHLIITVPAFNLLWSTHDDALHHRRRYTSSELRERLVKCGFRVIDSSYWNFFLFPIIFLTRQLRRISTVDHGLKSDLTHPPSIINKSLQSILDMESKLLINGLHFPFGVSIVCLSQKVNRYLLTPE